MPAHLHNHIPKYPNTPPIAQGETLGWYALPRWGKDMPQRGNAYQPRALLWVAGWLGGKTTPTHTHIMNGCCIYAYNRMSNAHLTNAAGLVNAV